MKTTTLALVALLGLALLVPAVPTAQAGCMAEIHGLCVNDPLHGNCLQVYPWSRLCEGDVGGFLCAFRVCTTTLP